MPLRLARLLLALALLAGWQAALLHPLQHLDDNGQYVHPGGDSGKSKPAKLLACDTLAALAACLPQMPAALSPLCCPHDSPPSRGRSLWLAAAAPPFLSQGPPASL